MICYHFILEQDHVKHKIYASQLNKQYFVWLKRADVKVYNLCLIKKELNLTSVEYYHEKI